MKKLIYCALALAAGLFATSCMQENLEPVQSGTTVTYTVNVPEVATKAVGEADNVNNLVYAVYRVTNTDLTDEEAKVNLATVSADFQLMYQEDTPVVSDGNTGKKSAYVSLELINDQRYVVIFWAQKDYTWFAPGASFTSVTYQAELDGNNDAYDAFTNVDVITVDRPISKDITLVRPFAQLNIATVVPGPTTEYPDRYTDFQVATTGVVVTGVARSFNVGAQVGETVGEVTFSAVAPLQEAFTNSKYPEYLSMNYVFVPANQSNVTVSYDINTNNYGTVENTVPNVPLARNYRTNIIGNLLTSEVDYNVELAPWYENSNSGTTEVIVDGLVKNQKGDYEVYTAVGLAHAINHHFVNAEGVANPATFYIKPGIYDMAQQAIKDVTVTSGTLKVYDTEAVVTRSATTGSVVIKGLKKALIQTVKDGATVFFSGITVTDFNGEDDAAALVQTNEGKVVLADCQILDENDAPDQDTKLVDGNEPVEVEKGEEAAGDLIYTAEQLAAAFEDESVESIALGADITLENTLVFPQGRTATLDLRGWELTIADPDKVETTYALNNHGTLTIKDSYATGSVNARGIYNGYVAGGDPIATATLTIESGTFNAKGTNGGAAVFNYGIAEIKGGSFTGYTAFNNQTGGEMTIYAADITEKTQNYAVQNNGGELIINNINLTQGIGNYNGTLTINGGKIHTTREGSSHAIYVGGGEISIHGGDFMGNGNEVINSNSYTANIYGGTFTKDPNGKTSYLLAGTNMTIYGGTFNAHASNPTGHPVRHDVTVMGGTFNYNPQGQNKIPEGYISVENSNGTWTVFNTKIGTEEALKTAMTGGCPQIILCADINLTEDWTPVGTSEKPYGGVFDGNGHKISGLKVSGDEVASLIAFTAPNTVIKNVTLENVDLEASYAAAGLIYWPAEGNKIENVTVSGTINGNKSYAAGLVFYAENLTIKNCKNYANVSAAISSGLSSWVTSSNIENVENHGSITGTSSASGISNRFSGNIKNAANYGQVKSTGSSPAAGVVGIQLGASTYEYCYNYVDVISTKDDPNASAAGILGQTSTSATLKYCSNYGSITAEMSYAGGIAYSLYGNINANYCYNAGAVAGADGAGAIAPKAQYGTGDKASYCLNAGTITSNGTVYQGSNNNTSCYYYNGSDLLNVTGNTPVAVEDALAVLNGGTDNSFFTNENGKIVVK